MEFSTKETKSIARQYAQVLIEQIDLAAGMPIGELERMMREQLQEIGRIALGEVLSQAEEVPVRRIACECGGELKYQRRREAKVRSVFDWVTYQRSYYANCECGEGRAPLDEKYGLEPGGVTAGLASLMAMTGVVLSFEQSRQFLERFLLLRSAGNSVRKETQRFGQLQEHQEDQWMAQYDDDAYLQARARKTKQPPQRVYGSIDGAFVRIEEDAPDEKWREMKLGCWYTVEAVPERQKRKRHREKAAVGHQALRAKNIQYYCELDRVEQFEPLFWATGCRAQADLAPEVVFVCDGARWIWRLVETHYPNAVQIVDWYHAEERLEKVAEEAFTNRKQASAWLEDMREALWYGDTDLVIKKCQCFTKRSEQAQKAAKYFKNNAHRMRYDHYRQQGYMIGSGTVESGCKQIVTQRLKHSGAQWTVEGANLTAKARAAWLGGDWDLLCARRERLPLAV